MHQLINSTIDRKNRNLAKLVYGLRQELDIYELISVNADNINKQGVGKKFIAFLQNLAIASITLSICKIFEVEGKYELYSIDGVFRNLIKKSAEPLDITKTHDFIKKYEGVLVGKNLISCLEETIKGFRERYKKELDSFKTFRDKYAAHSEYGFNDRMLPSFDVMEKLFSFAADFCELVDKQFVGVHVLNLRGKDIKHSFLSVLKKLGYEDIIKEMQ